jgi:hypothetical protein
MIQQSKKTLTLKMKAGTVMLRTPGNCWCTDSVTSRYIMDWFDLEGEKTAAVSMLDAVTLIHETK